MTQQALELELGKKSINKYINEIKFEQFEEFNISKIRKSVNLVNWVFVRSCFKFIN